MFGLLYLPFWVLEQPIFELFIANFWKVEALDDSMSQYKIIQNLEFVVCKSLRRSQMTYKH